ncbi:Uncharacterized protein APZ42_031244 [Daphnia magna]|uniref:Uncharacterized protein n=1 Tax=Daphnia magna TaxID=35525 RepID=A0A162DBY9_9CRUS|nr:Uncharacterized protein APZ42_031244 [Daphnia magna]
MDKAVTKVMNVEIAMIIKVSPIAAKNLNFITYSRLSDHPSQPQEEHNTPDAHHVANENSFDPAEFVAYSIIVMCFNCLLFNRLLLVVKVIGFAMIKEFGQCWPDQRMLSSIVVNMRCGVTTNLTIRISGKSQGCPCYNCFLL